MKKYVYLAGPIEGCDEGEINIWRKKCADPQYNLKSP